MPRVNRIIGVYQIFNTVNGKRYIGSSKNILERLSKHKTHLKGNSHQNKHLQAAYNKYGASSFVFEIVQRCEVELQFILEQEYMDKYKGGLYNKTEQAQCPTKGRKLSEEDKAIALLKRKPRDPAYTIVRNCQVCNKEYKVWPYRVESKYCSHKCYSKSGAPKVKRSRTVAVVCGTCTKEFSTTGHLQSRGKGKFCSQACCWENQRTRRNSPRTEFKSELIAERITKACPKCKADFQVTKRREETKGQVYCGWECYRAVRYKKYAEEAQVN